MVVSIPAYHTGDLGSITGNGAIWKRTCCSQFSFFLILMIIYSGTYSRLSPKRTWFGSDNNVIWN